MTLSIGPGDLPREYRPTVVAIVLASVLLGVGAASAFGLDARARAAGAAAAREAVQEDWAVQVRREATEAAREAAKLAVQEAVAEIARDQARHEARDDERDRATNARVDELSRRR
jgi:predicted lysophospholipase L1 biosynthesis ABC-type transport system permease subunit